jgi:hypothetical protein
MAQLAAIHAVHNAFESIICDLLALTLPFQLHCVRNPIVWVTEVRPQIEEAWQEKRRGL